DLLMTVTVGVGRNVTLAAAGSRVIDTSALVMAGATDAWTGKLDLNDNNMIVRPASGQKAAKYGEMFNQLHTGLNLDSGYWNGNGIISSTAAADTALHGLGIILNDSATVASNVATGGSAIYSTFAGKSVDADSILVMYTRMGDANLD